MFDLLQMPFQKWLISNLQYALWLNETSNHGFLVSLYKYSTVLVLVERCAVTL